MKEQDQLRHDKYLLQLCAAAVELGGKIMLPEAIAPSL